MLQMKVNFILFSTFLLLAGCEEKPSKTAVVSDSFFLNGTWQLVSSKIIAKGDTTVTFPVANQEMIKIFNDKDFAFFKHNVNHQPGDSSIFDAGSGSYTLNDENYTEHLAYCTAREWENRDFSFKLRVQNDTLTQTGIEKIDSLNINQEIVEIYVKRR